MIIGIGALITPFNFPHEFNLNLVFSLWVTFLIWVFSNFGKKSTISRTNGSILLLLFAIYMFTLFT